MCVNVLHGTVDFLHATQGNSSKPDSIAFAMQFCNSVSLFYMTSRDGDAFSLSLDDNQQQQIDGTRRNVTQAGTRLRATETGRAESEK